MAQSNAATSNCISCSEPDDTNMVTCSWCIGSYHRSCCGIGETEDIFTWICNNCASFHDSSNLKPSEYVLTSTFGPNNSTSPRQYHAPSNVMVQTSPPPLESIRNTAPLASFQPELSRKKQLQLQELEEEMLLRREFLRRKYELLYTNSEDCQEIDQNTESAFIRHENGQSREMQNIRAMVDNIQLENPPNPQTSRQQQTNASGIYNGEFFGVRESDHNNTVNNLQSVNSVKELGDNATCNNNAMNPTYVQTRKQSSNVNRVHNRGEFINIAEIPTISHVHIPQHQSTQIPRSSHRLNVPQIGDQNNNTIDCQTRDVNKTNYENITTTQLVARQTISRELPMFNGDPKEWPIFFSAFEQSSRIAGYSDEENLVRLQKSLQGKAREAVRNCLMLPDMVPDIMRTLKMYFGRPECILKNVIEEVRKISLQRGKLENLIEFAFAVKNICATIRASQLNDYLNNPTLLQELVDKLSPETILQWAMHSRNIPRPNLMDFSDWLYTVAEATCRVTVPVFDMNSKHQSKREGRLNTHTDSTLKEVRQQCVVCGELHKIAHCSIFKDLPSADKWDIVKSKNLCRICLGKHRRRCWFSKECGINGCTVQHNALLHTDETTTEGTVSSLNSHKNQGESYFRIVPVTLYGESKSIKIYALMDDGSTLTLLEQEVADALGIQGVSDPLCLRWTGDVSRYEDSSQRLSLRISSILPNSKIHPISNVYTVKNLNLLPETMDVDKIKSQFSHLKNIPLSGYRDVIPSMIIGVNNPNLISSIRTREGAWQQPVAVKTRLGWTIFGGGSTFCTRLNLHKCNCENLHSLVNQYFSDESIAITAPSIPPMSEDEKRAIYTLENTCEFNNGHYEVGLLWKTDFPVLPNSLGTAIKRLQCLQRKSKGDPRLLEIMQQQIESLVEKGYAERLPLEALKQQGDKIWYLPTFIVKNPQKPNKIRLVWDAAAKSGEFSLNDFLLKGPDLLRPLMNILFKFRLGAVGVCGDIAEMFHRIKVRKEDATAQRFLWWDENNELMVYQLNVVTFGASCSPCIVHFVRDKNAQNFGCDRSVVEAITMQHYVDDYIDSAKTVEDAIELAVKVRDTHSRGGFYMRNWSSNSGEVLAALGESNSSNNKSFDKNENSATFEKILGLYWNPRNDEFKMNLKFVRLRRPILCGDIVPTKREVLQVLMSVFDPLGFVSCYMSYLKQVLQEIWRSNIDWDQPLTEDLYYKWKNWLSFLPSITVVSIPRCYSMALQKPMYKAEMHTFVDASEYSYAAVSYFRIELNGEVELRLVCAKSKVAPLKPVSIPRLELQAATIGARLTQIVQCHDIKIDRIVMWTDSKTVLSWLGGDPRKYKQFVMFRIAEILKFTSFKDWRWVPSALNVADFATKFRPASSSYLEWFSGPPWLLLPENDWPKSINECLEENTDTTEVRRCYLNLHTVKSAANSINFEYFSSWFRLCRALGNWILLLQRRRQVLTIKTEANLNASHFKRAKHIIYKMIQIQGFSGDYYAVQAGKPVLKGSVLDKLNLYTDEDGIIRLKNRARFANPLYGLQRDLIVLPGNHHATRLIVNDFHRAYHHANHETIINEIRQIFFIVKLRVTYKIVRRSCQQCKNEAAKPISPSMSPLPPARLGVFQRPFTFVGVDYFGPIIVTFGRKSLKRWGVIFTCLTIRAVHIEISHSLSTDSFLMVLRNFISRRGCPAEIYSDNGTNFRGADRILKEEIERLDFTDIYKEMASKGITWKYNPPAAPHMGGAWERLVRSIKTILYKISPAQKFTDESLRSGLMEVEMIINSRPLTFVSLDSEDQEAITPNHFLLGSSSGVKPFCSLDNIDYKFCLRQSEAFANQFWRRFVKEMLPTLTRRSKWYRSVKPINVDDIVVIVDENADRNVWLKGRVVEVVRAKDGQVRRAKVKTKNGFLERPAVKLAVLDIGNKV